MVLEALGEMGWDDVSRVASILLVQAEDQLALIRALGEDVAQFRSEWKSVEGNVPSEVSRASFVSLSKISLDEQVVPKAIFWAARALQEAEDYLREYVSDSYPELGKTVYGPAGDPKEGPLVTRDYMTPHTACTDSPDKAHQVQSIRTFVPPAEREARRAKRAKVVDGVIQMMQAAANAAGAAPEGMFLNRWRDIHRERVRYS